MSFTDLIYLTPICLISIAVLVLFWLITAIFLFRSVDRNLRRCPNCKRGATGTISESDTEPLEIQIDRRGLTTIRYKREKVTDYYRCDHCGHTWTRSFERKQHIPIQR